MWTDIIDDTKMNHLSDQQYRYFTYLMALASEENNDGKITMPDEDIIWRLRMDSLDTLNNLKDVLENLKIIIWSPGEIVFINWEKRQPKSDNSTARVKAFRDRQKKTGCNGSETDKKRPNNQTETPPDTHTSTHT
ncbi:MAG: hypothetical protein GY729_21560, partial [Desulfobacteraceae bacterium]|nr:hypothetical protein [Desulfobacteraceae bacterium]